MRADRAGIGERQAGLEAETGRDIIQRADLQRVALLGDDDHGRVADSFSWRVARLSRRCLALALDAVGGQAWQPQAEDTSLVR